MMQRYLDYFSATLSSSGRKVLQAMYSLFAMNPFYAITLREIRSFGVTPVAYVFVVVFLLLSGIFTIYLGNYYQASQADMTSFFQWIPWLYLFFIPAMAMRSFSEELHSGTIELLLTFGAPLWQIVMAKFIAIWLVCLIALSGTFPIVAVTFYLGNPDIGPIITGYVGASLLAGIYVSIGIAMSSITQNQVIAFVLSASLCFVLMVSGYDMILNFFEALGFSQGVLDAISSLSLSLLIDETMRGLLTLNHAVYTLSLIVFWLYIASFVNHNMTEAAS